MDAWDSTEGHLPRNEKWKERAACIGKPASWFFPPRGTHGVESPVSMALATCAACPVRAQCLEYALDEVHGVWGGQTARQRRSLRRVGAQAKVARAAEVERRREH